MSRRFLIAGLWLLGLICAPSVFAHKLEVFAFADGNQIEGKTYFPGGTPAGGAKIQVLDSQGQVVAELSPDADGKFTYVAPAAKDYTIVSFTADGHRAQWQISAGELSAGFPQASSAAPSAPATPAAPRAVPATTSAPSASELAVVDEQRPAGLDPQILEAIELAVERQVRPLREQLIEAQDHEQMRDILGGIGYIMGLTGIGFWWVARRRLDKGRNSNTA